MKVDTKLIKINSNISTAQKILNYFRVKNDLPNSSTGAFRSGAKWSNTMYRMHVGLSGSSRTIDRSSGNYPHFDHIGCADSIISPEMYNAIHSVVLKYQAQYYVQVDEGQVDEVTDLVIAILEGSFTLYAMTVALWRTQNGYLFKDEDKCYLGPIFLNHDQKGASVADWNVSANNSFAEVVLQTSLNTQAKIQASNEVWGCYGVANEAWANMVSQVLNCCYLPHNLKWMAEHLFGTVFVDPQKTTNVSTVTFFPDSTLNVYSFDDSTGVNDWVCTPTNLNGYDSNSNDDGATNLDNGGSFNDYLVYATAWSECISELFNHYPYLDSILYELKFTNGSNFDFTRDIEHATMYFVTNENISDFIESVALVDANPEVPDIYSPLSQYAEVHSLTVRDQIDVTKYGDTLSYHDEVDITLDYSMEYFWRGKVYAQRFAVIVYSNNSRIGDYLYQYAENRICSNFGNTAYILSIMYLNMNLDNFQAIQPILDVEMASIPASGLGGTDVIVTTSIRTYYNAAENLANYAYRSYDTFIAPEFQKNK